MLEIHVNSTIIMCTLYRPQIYNNCSTIMEVAERGRSGVRGRDRVGGGQ